MSIPAQSAPTLLRIGMVLRVMTGQICAFMPIEKLLIRHESKNGVHLKMKKLLLVGLLAFSVPAFAQITIYAEKNPANITITKEDVQRGS